MQYKVELSQIGHNYVLLTHEEFINKIKQYKESHDMNIKEELVLSNLKLVLSIVSKYNQTKYSLDDLFQVGMIGLIKAIDYFDVNFDVKFSTYAHPLILGEIKRYIRDDHGLKVSRSIHDLTYKIIRLKDEYMQTNNIEPSISYLAKILEVNENDIVQALNSTYSISSLSQSVHNESDHPIELIDTIESHNKEMDLVNNRLSLNEAMKHLNEKEKYIIENRYYLDRTQNEIAEELMISQAQVSRSEKSALKHLRQYL